jgi:transposase
MINLNKIDNVYLITGFTDLRKQADGLIAILKSNEFEINKNSLYIFCGRTKDKIKIVHFDYSGIWVYYKRLNDGKFNWPKSEDNILIDQRQLKWFLEGLNIYQPKAHKYAEYEI